jgi:anti-sigma B factor antagonist
MVARIQPGSPRTREGMVCMPLEGPVDLNTVPVMRNRLLSCAKKREIKILSVNMDRVTQLDTAGVAMLVELWRVLARRGGKLRLSGLSENARRLVHLAGLNEILKIEDIGE